MRFAELFGLTAALRGYTRRDLAADGIAGLITAILLVPQGIAFALLAGLPPQAGLYASILPMMVYALLGTSRTLSVGPVSVAAIMVASALAEPTLKLSGNSIDHAAILAFEGGIFLVALSVLRLGVLANSISNAVLAGFTSGAAILIILSQMPHLVGSPPSGHQTGLAALRQLPESLAHINGTTLVIGLGSVLWLVLVNRPLGRFLTRLGIGFDMATAVTKLGPLLVVIASAIAVDVFSLSPFRHVQIVGPIPSGLPFLSSQFFDRDNWLALAPSALFIALIGYVESIAIAKSLAIRRQESLNPNRELLAIGCANIAAAFSGTMPVAGGFSRTMVNYAAGARTQIAAIVTALVIALAVMFFATWFNDIPKAALAAIIIVAIVPLVDIKAFAALWRANRSEGIVFIATFLGVLLWGIEQGLALGIGLSLIARLWFGPRSNAATTVDPIKIAPTPRQTE